jgi:hypothetical protein
MHLLAQQGVVAWILVCSGKTRPHGSILRFDVIGVQDRQALRQARFKLAIGVFDAISGNIYCTA